MAGQMATDPNTNEMIHGSIEEQTERVLENIGAVLKKAGSGFEDGELKEALFETVSFQWC